MSAIDRTRERAEVTAPDRANGQPVRLLHTSDCHLGSDERGKEEAAFERAIACAHDERVDAVLIAGDLFDHIRVSDETLLWTAAQLGRLACPVVVIR